MKGVNCQVIVVPRNRCSMGRNIGARKDLWVPQGSQNVTTGHDPTNQVDALEGSLATPTNAKRRRSFGRHGFNARKFFHLVLSSSLPGYLTGYLGLILFHSALSVATFPVAHSIASLAAEPLPSDPA